MVEDPLIIGVMEDQDKYESVLPENGGGAETAADQEIQALKQERDSLYDRLLRKQAEFENYKKRMDREKAEYLQFAAADVMKELLNVLDSFELAIRNAAADPGFGLIYKQFQDTLGRFGLKPIDAKGQKFDPNFHQAVSTQPSNEVEENTVIEEMRKGYVLNGRLLRPAMVSVSKKE